MFPHHEMMWSYLSDHEKPFLGQLHPVEVVEDVLLNSIIIIVDMTNLGSNVPNCQIDFFLNSIQIHDAWWMLVLRTSIVAGCWAEELLLIFK